MEDRRFSPGWLSVAAYLFGLDRAQTPLGLITTTIDVVRYVFLCIEAWIEETLSRSGKTRAREKAMRLIPLPSDTGRHEIVIRLSDAG